MFNPEDYAAQMAQAYAQSLPQDTASTPALDPARTYMQGDQDWFNANTEKLIAAMAGRQIRDDTPTDVLKSIIADIKASGYELPFAGPEEQARRGLLAPLAAQSGINYSDQGGVFSPYDPMGAAQSIVDRRATAENSAMMSKIITSVMQVMSVLGGPAGALLGLGEGAGTVVNPATIIKILQPDGEEPPAEQSASDQEWWRKLGYPSGPQGQLDALEDGWRKGASDTDPQWDRNSIYGDGLTRAKLYRDPITGEVRDVQKPTDETEETSTIPGIILPETTPEVESDAGETATADEATPKEEGITIPGITPTTTTSAPLGEEEEETTGVTIPGITEPLVASGPVEEENEEETGVIPPQINTGFSRENFSKAIDLAVSMIPRASQGNITVTRNDAPKFAEAPKIPSLLGRVFPLAMDPKTRQTSIQPRLNFLTDPPTKQPRTNFF